MKKMLGLILLTFILVGCKKRSDYTFTKVKISPNAMVVSAHPIATQIGLEILEKGGNAVDAAIATQFALAVVYPAAGNIGGGGFMIYRESKGSVYALDYREKAPMSATRDMYLDSLGNAITHLSLDGHLAAGVPGTVDGLWQSFQKFSALKDWRSLIEPSIQVARNGVVLTEREANGLNGNREKFREINGEENAFTLPEYKAGDLFIQESLALTLERIADKGRDGFYEGETAELIVAEMASGGGIITAEDLTSYQSKWREPISFEYRGHKIYTMPPPSSGGLVLAQIMKSVEPFELGSYGYQSSDHIHIVAEAERRAYADRSIHMGDPDFYKVPMDTLLDSIYIAQRMSDFSMLAASRSDSVSAGEFAMSEQTTHLSIVDKDGNAVSVTTTLNGGYGSRVVVSGAGFILNNEMDDFSVKPGEPNLYGLIGAEANKVEGGKRMLSSMTPTIVTYQDSLKYVLGTPGGSTIITSVFQVLTNLIDFKMEPGEAVAAQRFHHQWRPDLIYFERDRFSINVIDSLKAKGHQVEERSPIGRLELIEYKVGKLIGAADPRGDDTADGY